MRLKLLFRLLALASMSPLAALAQTPVAPLDPAAAAPASGPMVVTYTTWLRADANETSRALDEIGTGMKVDVQGCQGAWCKVSEGGVAGFVQQRYLAAAMTTLVPTADKAACFPGTYYTAEGPLFLTICPATAH